MLYYWLCIIMLTVAKPPSWAKNMEFRRELWETSGKTLELKCPAGGYPTPKIQWLKDDKPLLDRAIGTVSIHDLCDCGIFTELVRLAYVRGSFHK